MDGDDDDGRRDLARRIGRRCGRCSTTPRSSRPASRAASRWRGPATTASPPSPRSRSGRCPRPSKARSSSPTSTPLVGYTIKGEGEGGIAGFAKGGAKVALADAPGGTLLHYDVEAHVGGKIAQLGARLIDGVAKNMADKFFANFAAIAPQGRASQRRRAGGGSIHRGAAPAANRRPRPRRLRRRRQSRQRHLGSGGYGNGSCLYGGKRTARFGRSRSENAAGAVSAREPAPDRHPCRLRHLAMRRLRRPCRRAGDQVLHRAGRRAARARR